MALRNQPYIPLYVQDVLTDEKLSMCSAESHGVYFLLLCILHKQDEYGSICLKQKHKQTESKFDNFAILLSRQMPFSQKQIKECLEELDEEGVIICDNERLYQKRMVKDGNLSMMRSKIGKKGGSNVTKQYGKSGFLYLMSDGYTKHKIGISVSPKSRLYRLRSDLKLPKNFEIIETIPVSDMGLSEDLAQKHFDKIRDGEWLIGDFNSIKNQFDLLKAKNEANTKANSENEIENENEGKTINVVMPFESENFANQWQIWKDYKKREHKFNYKTAQSEQAALKQLAMLCNGNEKTAIEIIHQSLANGWKGFFELKTSSNGATKQSAKDLMPSPEELGVGEHSKFKYNPAQ